MARLTRLQLQSLESREVPSGNRLFAIGQELDTRIAVYESTSHVRPPGSNVFQGPNGDWIATGVCYPTVSVPGRLVATVSVPWATGGARIALGDINADQIDDLVVCSVSGRTTVQVYDGQELLAGRVRLLKVFLAFDAGFAGGAFVATGQVDRTTPGEEIVVGAGSGGGPHVKVFL